MFFFFKQKTAYDMRISDWSSDVCSSDLLPITTARNAVPVLANALIAIPPPVDEANKPAPFPSCRATKTGETLPGFVILKSATYSVAPELSARMAPWLFPSILIVGVRSEENTYELQSLMSIPYAVCCWKNVQTSHE